MLNCSTRPHTHIHTLSFSKQAMMNCCWCCCCGWTNEPNRLIGPRLVMEVEGAIVVKQTRVEIKLSYEKCCDANVVVEVKRVTRRRRRHRIVFLRVCSTITFWVPKLDLLRWRRGKIVHFITIDMLMVYVLFLFCFFYLPVSRTANVWFVVLPLTAKSHWYINPYARIGKKD